MKKEDGLSCFSCRCTRSTLTGSPLPRLTWHSADGDLLDETSTAANDGGGVANTLRVDRLSRRHFRARFTCRAANEGAADAETVVIVDMRRKFFLYFFLIKKFISIFRKKNQ